jgi:hypothetical protein
VLDVNDGRADGPLQPGVVAHVTIDGAQEGALQADCALAATGCQLLFGIGPGHATGRPTGHS